MNFKWIKNELISNKNWIIIWISKLCRISLNSQFLSIKGTTIGITVWLRVCPTPVRAITWHPKFFSWSKFHNETECCILGFFLSEFYLYLYRVFGGGKIISQNDVIGRLRHLYWFIIQFTVEVLNFHWKKVFSVMPVVQPLSDFLVRHVSGIPGP